jgi:hypothetical protein
MAQLATEVKAAARLGLDLTDVVSSIKIRLEAEGLVRAEHQDTVAGRR